ncbi:hypothetical protein CRYUN_Cryun19dG0147500 [Craigia yunnanensis]
MELQNLGVMCHQNSCLHLSVEESDTAVENLLVYCKPVELYNILHLRALDNPSFLRRCLKYKIQARRRRLRGGIVIFNYKDYGNMLQKTEVTEEFSCPLCLMKCASLKGLRYHLCSSHDLFNFDFWVTEEYQAVNVSVKFDSLISEVKFPSHPKSERASKSIPIENYLQNGWHGVENYGSDFTSTTDCLSLVATGCDGPGVSIAMAHSPVDPDCIKSLSGSDIAVPPAKTRKIMAERSEPRNRMLLLKSQFFHSHRVQPMALDQVMSDRDSEDEVDDDIADLEDCRVQFTWHLIFSSFFSGSSHYNDNIAGLGFKFCGTYFRVLSIL